MTNPTSLELFVMIEKEIKVIVFEYEDIEELNTEDQIVVKAAQEALNNAYSPYSKFSVGAAVLLDNGEIVQGSNQENAAYPSGLCAERVALFYANSKYPEASVKTLAISALKAGKIIDNPIPPCGACRQVILETEQRFEQPIKIILAGAKGIQVVSNAKSLLPLTFGSDWLE